MAFEGRGRPLSDEGITRTCGALGCAKPAVWAVLAVETSGFGFLQDRRPRILFERHVFHRLTGGRFDATHPDISNETRGGYESGAREYPRLERAIALDEDAALKSASWGVGQVMGFNHLVAGFPSVTAMVEEMKRGEDVQLMAMANFIKDKKLTGALQGKDWAAFALGYNGKGFKENNYDTKLAAAHAKYEAALPNLTLRTAQAALTYLALEPGEVDGLVGKRTRAALMKFQANSGLPQTGELDPTTEVRLLAEAFPAEAAHA